MTELDKIIEERAEDFAMGRLYPEKDASSGRAIFQAGAQCAITPEVLAKVPEVKALINSHKMIWHELSAELPSPGTVDAINIIKETLKPWEGVSGD